MSSHDRHPSNFFVTITLIVIIIINVITQPSPEHFTGARVHSMTLTDCPDPSFFFLITQLIPVLSPYECLSPLSLKETRVGTMKEALLLRQEIHSFIWNTKFQSPTC